MPDENSGMPTQRNVMKLHPSYALACAILGAFLPAASTLAQNSTTLPTMPTVSAPTPAAASTELRGLWVVRNDLCSAASIRHVVAMAKAHGFNALFVQVRGRGDAYYQTALVPRAAELAGQPKSFDPLATVIQEAHASGLQVHAWMNVFYVWSTGHKPANPNHVVNLHPDWLARDAQNHYRLGAGPECEGAFLSPANLAARQHIHNVFLDVARHYDVDGIHFDYIRYASGAYDYSDAALTRFQAQMAPTLTAGQTQDLAERAKHDRLAWPHLFPAQWQQFRRDQVTDTVAWISHDIKAIKPWVVISAAVFANSEDAFNARGQDWKTWLERGYLDALEPEAYGADTAKVAAQIQDAVTCAHESCRYVYAGIGAWHIPASSAIAKIAAARRLGAEGSVLFSYGGITRDGVNDAYLNAVASHCFQTPAGLPHMAWLTPRPTQTASAKVSE
jgi:uncharacterized lipoprotein YddW (UPF0748 family)